MDRRTVWIIANAIAIGILHWYIFHTDYGSDFMWIAFAPASRARQMVTSQGSDEPAWFERYLA